MKKIFPILSFFLFTTAFANDKEKKVVLEMKTNQGLIVIELDLEKAPITSQNFLSYVGDDFFNGLIFHRVIDNFMIQGGGFTKDYKQKKGQDPIKKRSK